MKQTIAMLKISTSKTRKKPNQNLEKVLHISKTFNGLYDQQVIEGILKDSDGDVGYAKTLLKSMAMAVSEDPLRRGLNSIREIFPIFPDDDTCKEILTQNFGDVEKSIEMIFDMNSARSSSTEELQILHVSIDCAPKGDKGNAVDNTTTDMRQRCHAKNKDVNEMIIIFKDMFSGILRDVDVIQLISTHGLDSTDTTVSCEVRLMDAIEKALELLDSESAAIASEMRLLDSDESVDNSVEEFSAVKFSIKGPYEQAYDTVSSVLEGAGFESAVIQDALARHSFDVTKTIECLITPCRSHGHNQALWSYAAVTSSSLSRSQRPPSSQQPPLSSAPTSIFSSSVQSSMQAPKPQPLIIVESAEKFVPPDTKKLKMKENEWHKVAKSAAASMVNNFREAAHTRASQRLNQGAAIAGHLSSKGHAAKFQILYAESMAAMCALEARNSGLRLRVDRLSGALEFVGEGNNHSPGTDSDGACFDSGWSHGGGRHTSTGKRRSPVAVASAGGGSGSVRQQLTREVDLHGVRVLQALMLVESMVDYYRRRYCSASSSGRRGVTLRLIVGRGLHSVGGLSRLRPAVAKYCRDEGLDHTVGEAEVTIHIRP